ncbi:MAG: DNA topoisomerase (ATP-hydrolyzing) [Eubacteriales bacterium]|nr:DNA topoisomerase (ATP-hydrolyzing) [Eubacteriales bacterium]
MSEQIIKSEFSDIMQKSYIDYAMSVICQRALPDVRDGLKPVQRRVLYAMQELGLRADRPHRKSARIVGDTMGKYHPHGDSSIYDALVVMEQEFKKGMPLVDGHGNFGSIEGDGAAAMRYTEAKLQKFTQDVYLADMDKNIVDFQPNFDETEKEPVVLPVRIPNLLINGAEGIAVGMTTNIPPHNLCEVVDGIIAYMDNEEITVKELMQYIKGPDFPTGGLVVNQKDLLSIYETGSGKIKIRGKVEVESASRKNGKERLVISEIPYTMIGANIGKFIADVVNLIETKKTSDIVDISNESSKEGIRIVLELRKNVDVERLKNLLYKKTRLEDTFGVNMLAIVDGRPEQLSLKEVIAHHTKFHYELMRRKYTTLLERALEQKEIKEGLIQACDVIDLIIEVLRGSTSLKDAKACLIEGKTDGISFRTKKSEKEAKKLHFTEKQATAILEMRLYRLIGLEILALQEEYAKLLSDINTYEKILNDPKEMKKVIKKDLLKIKKEYGFERKTALIQAGEVVVEEIPVEEKEVVFVMDRFGYGKTMDKNIVERNEETVKNEYIFQIPCMNTDRLCVFTQDGNMHQIKVMDLPMSRLREKGIPLDNVSNYDHVSQRILAVIPMLELTGKELLFITKTSMVKFVDGQEYMVSKKTVASTKLADGDELIAVYALTEEEKESGCIVLQSANGFFLRFPLKEISKKKKAALGLRGMNFKEDDEIRAAYIHENGDGEASILYKEKDLFFQKLKLAARDGRGTKVRR